MISRKYIPWWSQNQFSVANNLSTGTTVMYLLLLDDDIISQGVNKDRQRKGRHLVQPVLTMTLLNCIPCWKFFQSNFNETFHCVFIVKEIRQLTF